MKRRLLALILGLVLTERVAFAVWGGDPRGQGTDYAPELHSKTHRKGANDYLPHFLSEDEELGPPGAVGDVIVSATVAGRIVWQPYALVVPGAGLRNVLAVDNGETTPTWQADEHEVLSARHSDTLTATVVAGDVIVGNATPKWSRLARSVPGTVGLMNVIGLANGETVPSWKAAEHALLSIRHSDAVAGSPVRGDLIVANSTPSWTKLATGGSGTVLAGGTDPAYTANPTVTTITTTGAATVGGDLDHNGSTISFFGHAQAGQQALVTQTNNVFAGGVADTIANYTDLIIYANDAATIRNDIYRLTLAVNAIIASLKNTGYSS